MNKRQRKKTQKERGFVCVGAWVRPELREALQTLAASTRRSMAAEIAIAIEAHVKDTA